MIPDTDPSLRLKLSGDFRTCGILKFEQKDRLKELNSIAKIDIGKLEREYLRAWDQRE